MGLFGKKAEKAAPVLPTGDAEELFEKAKALYAEEKFEESHLHYLASAEQGFVKAMNNVGCDYRDGDGVEKDVDKAIEWFEKARAAGSMHAPFNLANLMEGETEEELEKRFAYYQESVDRGYVSAMFMLGYCYYMCSGCELNYKLAAYWACKNIEGGEDDGYYLLGELYKGGMYLTECPAYARYCYDKASEAMDFTLDEMLGDAEGDMDVNEKIRMANPVKPVLPTFDDTAPDFFTEEDPVRQWLDGNAYLRGENASGEPVKIDVEKGRMLLEKSAKQGFATAYRSLAYRYLDVDNGPGVIYDTDGSVLSFDADNDKAIWYYQQGAKYGDEECIYALAELYTCGEKGVTANKDRAKEYWSYLYKLYQDENIKEGILDDFDFYFSMHVNWERQQEAIAQYIEKGKKALLMNDVDSALTYFKRAYAFNSGDAAYFIATLYEEQGDERKAATWYANAQSYGYDVDKYEDYEADEDDDEDDGSEENYIDPDIEVEW